jgi:hypothetical protein
MNNFKIAQMCLGLVRLCAVSMYHDRGKGKDKGEVHPIIWHEGTVGSSGIVLLFL